MLNLIPKRLPGNTLLSGKQQVYRILAGVSGQELEIRKSIIDTLYDKLDTSRSFIDGKYQSLPWKEFLAIKKDVNALMETSPDTSTGLPDTAEIFEKIAVASSAHNLSSAAEVYSSIEVPKTSKLALPFAK